jgi:hypothetical protein
MTMRLDIVTNDAGELVRREHARDLGANVVIAIYRLTKLAQLHDLTNQAFLRQLEQTHQAILEYGLRAGTNVNILFAQKAVFVAGQLLKGSRSTYEMATELGEILEWCGGSDLTVARDISPQEVHAFGEAVSFAMRAEKGKGYRQPSPKIRLRAVTDAARLRGLEIEAMTHEQRIVRNYASAVVIMRRFFEDLQASRYILPRRIKRVAQNLVDLSEGTTPTFLGVTEVRNQNHDDAGRAVNTAILAVAMARELTGDRVLLAQIAMAAMMHDVGRPRAAALSGAGGPRISGVIAKVSEDAEDKLAGGTAAVLTALGRVNEPTIVRTVVAYEALWLRRQRFIGPVYRGTRLPTLHAKIIQIARRYNDLVTPEPGLEPPSPDFAVATLSEELAEPTDRTVLRMLVATLGLFPVGTVVQLSTQEVAEVIPGRDRNTAPDRPFVRPVMDAQGAVFSHAAPVDLANPRPGEPVRRIVKVVSIDGWHKGIETRPAEIPASGSGMQQVPDSEPVPGGESLRRPDRPEATSPSEPPSVPSIGSMKSKSRPPREGLPNAAGSSGSGVVEVSHEASYPSAGTSPSMVAEAMGRVMTEGVPSPPGWLPESRAAVETASVHAGSASLQRPERALRSDGASSPAPSVSPSRRASEARPSIPHDRAPSARGTLASTPVVHVLVYMLDHGQSGTVVLREPDGSHHLIYFHEGSPKKVRTGRPIALLGDWLVSQGRLPADVLGKAVGSAKSLGVLLGEYLVGNDLISREELHAALASQTLDKLAGLVNLPPETDYAFYEALNLLETWGGELIPCDSLNAVLACVRSWHDRARIRATLGRITKQPLSFHPEADLSMLAASHEETAVIEAITSARTTIATLFQQQVADEETVSSVVYTFAVTRCFAFTASKGLPMGKRPSPVALQGTGPPPHLSVPPGVSSIPQQLAAPSVAPLDVSAASLRNVSTQPASARTDPPVSAQVSPPTEQAASSPPKAGRSNPVPSTASAPPDEADEAERALQAMTDFRLADTALQRNDLVTAERLARKAVEGDPENGEYKALLAWMGALSDKKDALKKAVFELNEILKTEALCERALMYRGKLLKRANRNEGALRDFLTVLDVNPKNSEAASEARLLRMKKKR